MGSHIQRWDKAPSHWGTKACVLLPCTGETRHRTENDSWWLHMTQKSQLPSCSGGCGSFHSGDEAWMFGSFVYPVKKCKILVFLHCFRLDILFGKCFTITVSECKWLANLRSWRTSLRSCNTYSCNIMFILCIFHHCVVKNCISEIAHHLLKLMLKT